MKPGQLLLSLPLALTLLLTGCNAPTEPPQRSMSPQPAPDITLHTLDGNDLNSAALKGKIVVLNFWSTWAPACAREIPELVHLREQIANPDVLFLGVCLVSSDSEDVRKYVANMKFNYPVATAGNDLYEKFGGLDAIPSTLIISPDWQLVNRYTGKLRVEDLKTELDYMQAELKRSRK